MPRGRKAIAVIQPGIIPQEAFTELSFWKKLNPDEQKLVQTEGQQLADALYQHGKSALAIGEHLTKLRDILLPHNAFDKFLRNFHFTKRTAYRYIAGFKNAKAMLPESVIKVAMAKGMNILGDSDTKPLGIYTAAVKQLPPPHVATEQQAATYLTQLEDVRKKLKKTEVASDEEAEFTVPVPQDPEALLKECYRFCSIRYKRLPNHHKTKAAWVNKLVGMLMADLGVSNPQTFSPIAVPEEFRAQRGRPREIAAAA